MSAPITGLQPGTAYTATLTASNASGIATSAGVAFTTTPASIPVQAHLAAPATADTGQDIPLDGSASSGAGLTYSWSTDAPGAEHVSGSHPTLSVRFDVPGSHQVTLTVTDAAGHSDTTTRTIAVSAPTLYATVLDPLIPTAGRPEHIKVRAADANGRLSPLPAGTLVTLGGDSAVRSRGSVVSGILLPGRDVSSNGNLTTTFHSAGTHQLTVSVQRPDGSSTTDYVQLPVAPHSGRFPGKIDPPVCFNVVTDPAEVDQRTEFQDCTPHIIQWSETPGPNLPQLNKPGLIYLGDPAPSEVGNPYQTGLRGAPAALGQGALLGYSQLYQAHGVFTTQAHAANGGGGLKQTLLDDVTWDFGDGGTLAEVAGQTPTHTFHRAGFYTVTLRVRFCNAQSSGEAAAEKQALLDDIGNRSQVSAQFENQDCGAAKSSSQQVQVVAPRDGPVDVQGMQVAGLPRYVPGSRPGHVCRRQRGLRLASLIARLRCPDRRGPDRQSAVARRRDLDQPPDRLHRPEAG